MTNNLILSNIEIHVGEMQLRLMETVNNHWNKETKNQVYRNIALEAVTLMTVLRNTPDTSATYEALNSICRQANIQQNY